jgi:hypothetical protein
MQSGIDFVTLDRIHYPGEGKTRARQNVNATTLLQPYKRQSRSDRGCDAVGWQPHTFKCASDAIDLI